MKYILILLSLAVLTGCGEKGKDTPEQEKYSLDETTEEITTVPVDDQTGSFLMRYKLGKNEKLSYKYTTFSESDQVIIADTVINQLSKQSVSYIINMNVVNVDADSIYEININVPQVKVEVKLGNQEFSYRSGTDQDSAKKAQFAEYEAVVNNPFSARVSKSGEIIEIFKADKIGSKFITLRGGGANLSSDERLAVQQQIVEGGLRPILMQLFRKIPEQPVAKDSVWFLPKNTTRIMVFDVTNEAYYKIVGLEKLNDDMLAVFSGSLATSIKGNNKVTENGVNYVFTKPQTSAEGKIYFNLDKGIIQKSNTSTSLEFSYTMEADTPQGKQKGTRKEKLITKNSVELLK